MKVLTYPKNEKELRAKGVPVTKEMRESQEFLQKLEEMKATAKEDGIGLAAPQVGWNINLFLLLVNRDMQRVEPEVVINPEIISKSKETVVDGEGCLSFPGLALNLARPVEITWTYENLSGEKVTVTDRDFFARVIQHEIDHCNGTLFIDNLSSAKRLKFEKWLKGQ